MELITRCPSCQVAFRVTPAQLKAAAGKVRCGACLNVFMAEEHKELPPEDSVESTQPTADSESDSDTQDISTPEPEATAPEQPSLIEDIEADATSESADDTATEEAPQAQAHIEADTEAEIEVDITAESDTAVELESAEPDLSLNETSEEPEPAEALATADTPITDYAHQLPAPDPATETLVTEPPINEPSITEPPVNELPSGEVIELGCDATDTDDVADDVASNDDNPFLNQTPTKRKRLHPGMIAACLLAACLLPLQYLYFNFESLSQQPEHRDWLGTSCQWFGCELPLLADINQIHSRQLLVIEHPQTDNALQVNAVIINRAEFEQPFPNLTLRFEDLQGAVVAERTFAPTDYIGGELSPEQPFPANRPVKIQLDIVDPGPLATNYSLLVTD